MIAQLHQLVRDDLGVLDQLALIEYRGAGHLVRIQPVEPLRGGALQQDLLGLLEALHHVDGAVVGRQVELVLEPVGSLEGGAEPLPLRVRDRADGDVAVAGAVDEVRREPRTGLGKLAVDDGEVDEPLRPEEGDHRVQHREPHVLAFAGAFAVEEGGGDRLGGGEGGHLVGDDGSDHHRTAGLAVRLDVRKTAQGLDDRVVDPFVPVGAALAEPADRDVDDVRAAGPDRVLPDPHPLDRAGAEVLDEHVRRLDQPVEQPPAEIGLEVEHDRLLAPVGAHERARDAADVVAHAPHDVPGGGLDLDDLGSLVGEHHGGDGPRDHGRQIHDSNSGKRTGHCNVLLRSGIRGGGAPERAEVCRCPCIAARRGAARRGQR